MKNKFAISLYAGSNSYLASDGDFYSAIMDLKGCHTKIFTTPSRATRALQKIKKIYPDACVQPCFLETPTPIEIATKAFLEAQENLAKAEKALKDAYEPQLTNALNSNDIKLISKLIIDIPETTWKVTLYQAYLELKNLP